MKREETHVDPKLWLKMFVNTEYRTSQHAHSLAQRTHTFLSASPPPFSSICACLCASRVSKVMYVVLTYLPPNRRNLQTGYCIGLLDAQSQHPMSAIKNNPCNSLARQWPRIPAGLLITTSTSAHLHQGCSRQRLDRH